MVSEFTMTVYSSPAQNQNPGDGGFYDGVVGVAGGKRVGDLMVGDNHVYLVGLAAPDFIAVELRATAARGHAGYDLQLILEWKTPD